MAKLSEEASELMTGTLDEAPDVMIVLIVLQHRTPETHKPFIARVTEWMAPSLFHDRCTQGDINDCITRFQQVKARGLETQRQRDRERGICVQ